MALMALGRFFQDLWFLRQSYRPARPQQKQNCNLKASQETFNAFRKHSPADQTLLIDATAPAGE